MGAHRRGIRNLIMRARNILICRRVFPCLLVFAFVIFYCVSRAQVSRGKIKNFTVPEYFEPPHETQVKSLFHGAEAEPQTNGLYLITQIKLETFSEDGVKQMHAEALHCIYDANDHSASSAGPMQAQTADGKFFVEGVGFLWRQTNSSLIISNRVHTVLRDGLIAPATL